MDFTAFKFLVTIIDMFEHLFHTHNKISVSDLAQLLNLPKREDELFVDVRRGDEWNRAHIDGFTHIALSELPLHVAELATRKKVFFICLSGGRSMDACDMMKKAGYENAYTVTGGIEAWGAKNYPLVT